MFEFVESLGIRNAMLDGRYIGSIQRVGRRYRVTVNGRGRDSWHSSRKKAEGELREIAGVAPEPARG